MFNSLCELHKENDVKLKDIVALYEERMSEHGFSEVEKQPVRAVLKENKMLREIA